MAVKSVSVLLGVCLVKVKFLVVRVAVGALLRLIRSKTESSRFAPWSGWFGRL